MVCYLKGYVLAKGRLTVASLLLGSDREYVDVAPRCIGVHTHLIGVMRQFSSAVASSMPVRGINIAAATRILPIALLTGKNKTAASIATFSGIRMPFAFPPHSSTHRLCASRVNCLFDLHIEAPSI